KMNNFTFLSGIIEKNQKLFTEASDNLWEYAETGYEEYKSAELLCEVLESEGFHIERGLAGMKTSFVASYGQGKPVIGLLGEYDALDGMSQIANGLEQEPFVS